MSNKQRSHSRRPGHLRRLSKDVKIHRALARQARDARYSDLHDGNQATSGRDQVVAQRRHVSRIGEAWTAAIMRRGKEKNLPLASSRLGSKVGPRGIRWLPGAMRKGGSSGDR